MEMMIVLLIMSIIAAATAPIVSKKMSKSASSSNSNPWVFIDTKGNAAFNMGGKDVTAVIGASKVPTGVSTRLYIDCGSSNSQLSFGRGDEVMQVTADPTGRVGITKADVPSNSVALGGNQSLGTSNTVAIGSNVKTSGSYSTALGDSASAADHAVAINAASASGSYSVAIGDNSKADSSASNAIAIGRNSQATGASSVAVGSNWGSNAAAKATGRSSVAIGSGAEATGTTTVAVGNSASATGEHYSISIGSTSKASGDYSTAIGWSSEASKTSSLAVGNGAKATHNNSTAIGAGARTTTDNQIVLGDGSKTVYIPGNLIVGCNTLLGLNQGYAVYLREAAGNRDIIRLSKAPTTQGFPGVMYASEQGSASFGGVSFSYQRSDRRLKNVGDKFTDGLDALKKLDLYNFTFKKDEKKTPHVGVMAQDLQKVFPNAVTKDEDGFLKIRMDEMFYAVINAIKELDAHICSVISKNDEQDKLIKELQKQNEELIKRIEKLEK